MTCKSAKQTARLPLRRLSPAERKENSLNPTLLDFMDDFDIIRNKADQHHGRYRSFDVAAFLRWIKRQTPAWRRWAAGQSISSLNRQRRCETWATIKYASRNQYTPVPPDDGPS